MPIVVVLPGLAVLLFVGFEMPKKVKKRFFKIPIWMSSTGISTIIGLLGRGVFGPSTGFVSEIILFPGLYCIKNKDKTFKKVKNIIRRKNKHGK